MKNTINIILRTTSPWHVAFPDNQSKAHDGMSLTQSKKVSQKPVPCFLANGIRGRLRRAIADRIIDVMTDVQGPIPSNVYIGMKTGSSSAQPDKSHLSVEELVRSQGHVYMGLFGGGSRTLKSRYKVSDINPILEHTVNAGIFPMPKEKLQPIVDSLMIKSGEDMVHLEPYRLLEKRFFFKVDDIARGVKMDKVIKAVDGGEDGVAKYLTGNQASDKARKGDETGNTKKTSVANMLSIECIATGTMMHFSVTVDPDVNEAQFGALLLGLKDIFDENYIGGWGRAGFGQFEVVSMGIDIDNFDIHETVEEKLYSEKHGFTYHNFSDAVKNSINEAETAIDEVSKDEMISYFTNLA